MTAPHEWGCGWEWGDQAGPPPTSPTRHGALSLAFLVGPTTGCVSLSKAHSLSEPQFPLLKTGRPESTDPPVLSLEQGASGSFIMLQK